MLGQTPWKGNNAPATASGRELYFMKVCSFYYHTVFFLSKHAF